MLGDLIVAAVFAAAVLTPTDRIVTDRRGWIATTLALCLGVLGVTELLGLALRDKLVLAAGHPVFGLDGAVSRPLTCMIVILDGTAAGLRRAGAARPPRVLAVDRRNPDHLRAADAGGHAPVLLRASLDLASVGIPA